MAQNVERLSDIVVMHPVGTALALRDQVASQVREARASGLTSEECEDILAGIYGDAEVSVDDGDVWHVCVDWRNATVQ